MVVEVGIVIVVVVHIDILRLGLKLRGCNA